MKKISLIFIGVICVLGIITGAYYATQSIDFRKLATDSGFDASFDSGGGFDSGGSSWDSGGGFDSGGSSWDSGYSRDSGGSSGLKIDKLPPEVIVLLVIMAGCSIFSIAVTIMGFLGYFNNNLSIKDALKDMSEADLYLIRIYGYDPTEIIMLCYNRYVDIQKAWAQNDIEKAKDLLTNDLYNMYKSEIAVLKAKKQRNAMSDFKYVGGQILSVIPNNDTLNIKIALQVQCKDYMLDETTNTVCRGSSSKINHYDYRMTFVVSKNESSVKCPNCNAPIKSKGNTITCAYCGSTIVRKTNNIVLAEKKMYRQS